MTRPIEIFFSYAHADEDLMNEVRRQLVVFERNGRIIKWHDRMIRAGESWADHIDHRLASADIVLLFMSPHFIESKYCYEIEAVEAMKRHQAGAARVVPVILRPCAWQETQFRNLQAVPTDGAPISTATDRDAACLKSAILIMSAVDEFQKSKANKPTVTSAQKPSAADPVGHDSGTNRYLVYCSRCGQRAGAQTICTGVNTSHNFVKGKVDDICSRCGVHPGRQGVCTGVNTYHAFVSI